MPRYGVIEVRHHPTGESWDDVDYIYVRQGEEADYIYEPVEADRITGGVLSGYKRDYARKFSPYNLTAQAFKDGSTQPFVQIPVNGAVFVDYPSQTGAYFQWGMSPTAPNYATNIRRAYHPTMQNASNLNPGYFTTDALWNPASGYAYKTDCETCPGSYYRPSDGRTDSVSFNGRYDIFLDSLDKEGDYWWQIEYSNFRVSLLREPPAGNGYREWGVFDPTLFPMSEVYGTLPGYYADGFFDRRPINAVARAVSTDNANIAYRGTLFFNPRTNASLFIPASGRIETGEGLKYEGETGYLWSSSVAPKYPALKYGVWGFQAGYWNLAPVSSVGSFGHSIRCVID